MDFVITGCSRGIGFELVKTIAAKAHRILAVSRNIGPLKEISEFVFPLSLDLTEPDFEQLLLREINRLGMKPERVIHNAGQLVNKTILQLTEADFDNMFHVNMKSVFLMIRALVPILPSGAHIVNIGSMGGYQGSVKFPGLSLYSASKAALAVFTECAAEEFKDKGIAVNCLALGSAQTEMLAAAFPGYQSPLTAAEMADFIADFSLKGQNYFNGKILPVSVTTP